MSSSDSDFGLGDAVRDALVSATSEVLKKSTEDVLKDVCGSLLVAAASSATSAFGASMIGALISACYRKTSETERHLHSLVREPFRTGLEIAAKALQYPAADAARREFREKRLYSAIESLDRAMSLAPANATDERKYIRQLQGLCARNIRGGGDLAEEKLGGLIAGYKKRIRDRRAEISVKHSHFLRTSELLQFPKFPMPTRRLLRPGPVIPDGPEEWLRSQVASVQTMNPSIIAHREYLQKYLKWLNEDIATLAALETQA